MRKILTKLKRIMLSTGMSLMFLGTSIASMTQMTAYAAELNQSPRWEGSGDVWRVRNQSGNGYLTNSWFQDLDQRWYMLSADGTMYHGLVTDQSTGKTYLLNTNHDGTFGAMHHQNGTYNVNGQTVALQFNQNHDGAFGAITSGLSEVRATGVSELYLAGIPEDSEGAGQAAAQEVTMVGGYDVTNVDADYAIEADVTLTGTGGAVAKVVIAGQASAIAFDIVTDGTTTYFYRESIRHNNAGGQDYSKVDYVDGRRSYVRDDGKVIHADYGKTYHLMVAFDKSTGIGSYYINGELIETFLNEDLTRSPGFFPAVETGGSVNGSTVQATFSNINVKKNGRVSSTGWKMKNMDNNPGMHSDTSRFQSEGIITSGGTILGLGEEENWDTAYNGTSAIIQFH